VINETEQGYTFVPCDWCKKNHARVVYKSWTLLCHACYVDFDRQDNSDNSK